MPNNSSEEKLLKMKLKKTTNKPLLKLVELITVLNVMPKLITVKLVNLDILTTFTRLELEKN